MRIRIRSRKSACRWRYSSECWRVVRILLLASQTWKAQLKTARKVLDSFLGAHATGTLPNIVKTRLIPAPWRNRTSRTLAKLKETAIGKNIVPTIEKIPQIVSIYRTPTRCIRGTATRRPRRPPTAIEEKTRDFWLASSNQWVPFGWETWKSSTMSDIQITVKLKAKELIWSNVRHVNLKILNSGESEFF